MRPFVGLPPSIDVRGPVGDLRLGRAAAAHRDDDDLPLTRQPLLYDLPEPDFKNALRYLNGTPEEVLDNDMLMGLLMPLLRADFAVNEAYTYTAERPLDCPIFAMGGMRDSEVSREQLEGWHAHTTASFELRLFPGDHFYLNTMQQLFFQVLSQDVARLARQKA